MEFRTIVELPSPAITLRPTSRVLFIGSCFATHIGERMAACCPCTDVNPFGVLYNPESIRRAVQILLTKQMNGNDIFQGKDGLWHSWMHHSSFSASTREGCIERIRQRLLPADLQQTDVLFITFGTASVFELIDDETPRIVGNCHKEPAARFRERMLDVGEIVKGWRELLQMLPPHLQIVFTVSPHRYQKLGFHRSQLSKARLLLAVEQLCEDARCSYFPAYEIVLDELRDYRFYDSDMLHPSAQSAEYVWERLRTWSFSAEMTNFANEMEALRRAAQHKPQNPDSEAHRLFLQKYQQRLQSLKAQWPELPIEESLT